MIFGKETWTIRHDCPQHPCGAPWDIPLVKPSDAGGEWRGIQHGELIDVIADEANAREWMTEDALPGRYAYTHSGACMIASIGFDKIGFDRNTIHHYLGVINSNNRRRGLTFYSGAIVNNEFGVVIDELTDDVKIIRHSDGTNWRDAVSLIMDRFAAQYIATAEVLNDWSSTLLTEGDLGNILILAVRRGLLPGSRLGAVFKELENRPQHGELSAYRLMRALSRVVGRGPASGQLDALYNLGWLMPSSRVSTSKPGKKKAG